MKNIAICGGCGFIGATCVNNFPANWTVIDDLSLGKRENVKAKVKFVQGDISDRQTVEENIKGGTDAVILMNGLSSNPMFYPDPRRGYETVLQGGLNVLENCRKRDIPMLVYASTSSLYGNTDAWEQEETALVTPPNFYSAAKRALEDAAKLYAETYGFTTIGARNFSIYGYPERHKGEYANIITQFIWKMMNRESPLLYGDGKQTRDFLFCEDLAKGIMSAVNSDLKGGHVINFGTGVDTSFNEVVEIINRGLGTTIKPTYTPNQIHNYIFTTRAQVARAEALLGWKAETDLETGIKKTIAYYSKNGKS